MNIRNTGQLEGSVVQLRSFSRLPSVRRIRASITHWRDEFLDERLQCLRPMAVSLCSFEELFFQPEFLLVGSGDGGVAGVDDKTGVATGGRDIVVRASRVPCDQRCVTVRIGSQPRLLGMSSVRKHSQRTTSPGSQLTLTNS